MPEDQEIKIARLEEQMKTLFSRLSTIESTVKVIPEMITQLQLISHDLCNIVKELAEQLDKQEQQIEEIEKKPSNYWDKVIMTIISTTVAALVSSAMIMITNGGM